MKADDAKRLSRNGKRRLAREERKRLREAEEAKRAVIAAVEASSDGYYESIMDCVRSAAKRGQRKTTWTEDWYRGEHSKLKRETYFQLMRKRLEADGYEVGASKYGKSENYSDDYGRTHLDVLELDISW